MQSRILYRCQRKKGPNSFPKLSCLQSFHHGASTPLTIEEKHGNNFLTVFALKGPRVYIASHDIFKSSHISNYYPKTDMYSIAKPVTE